MRRGEIWTAAGGPDDAGEPRPVVIVQSDRFDATASVTVCVLTITEIDAPLLRPQIAPSPRNGLRVASRMAVDKISTNPRITLGRRVGELDARDIVRLDRAIVVFLGLAGGH